MRFPKGSYLAGETHLASKLSWLEAAAAKPQGVRAPLETI